MGDEGEDPFESKTEEATKLMEEFREKYLKPEKPTTPWNNGEGLLTIILNPEYPENVSRHTKVQIHSENNPEQPLNIDIETLEYLHLQYVDLEKLLVYKYLKTEGSQQPVAGARDIFNKEITIPLNGGSDAKHILNLYHQTNDQGGTSRAIYGPEGSGLEQIMNELGEIERGLNEHGIRIDKRTGEIVIDGVALSPGEVRHVLEVAEVYQLWEGGHSSYAHGMEQQKLPQPCADRLREHALTPGTTESYEVTEVFNYSEGLFGVKAIKIFTEAESLPQMLSP